MKRPGRKKTMKQKNSENSSQHVGWLNGRLSHKALVALIALACLSGLLMFHFFLSYLSTYADNAYNKILSDSQKDTQQAAAFLHDCDGNFTSLKNYALTHKISCEVWDSSGKLLFEYHPLKEEKNFLLSNSSKVTLNSGTALTIRTWSIPIKEHEVSDSIRHSAIIGLFVLNICIFAIAAVLLYLLVLAPIVNLRRTFKEYYEQGALPERSSRQDEIGKLQNTFVDMVNVLENEEQAERTLIASVSHDIKTPLTSVMGFTERLLSADLTPEKRVTYLQNIYDKALAIKGIVDEFDEYLDTGVHSSSPMCLISMNDFCRAVKKEYQDELSDAGVQFTVECSCPGEQLRCNYGHMTRFLGNLIGNSIQHAHAEPLKLHLKCSRENDQIVLSFSDNGQGVPPEIMKKIFQPFFTTDRGRKVSGLGLTICENIIHAHGGTVNAWNILSGGLMVQARLPCAKL